MILDLARARPGGLEQLNRDVVRYVLASQTCMYEPKVQAAACGDKEALALDGASQEQLDSWAAAAAGGGYMTLLEKLIELGALSKITKDGRITPQAKKRITGASPVSAGALNLCFCEVSTSSVLTSG